MQPPPTIQLSEQQSTAYRMTSAHDDNGSQWSQNALLKKSSDASYPRAGPRCKVLADGTNPTAGNALANIYSPPSQSMPNTSQGIVVHALSVVDDQTTATVTEASLKKVAKKRRKQNGGVDVEHTKSNQEFLRKIQQRLMDSNVDDDTTNVSISRPRDDIHVKDGSSHSGERSVRDRIMNAIQSSVQACNDEDSATSKTTDSTAESNQETSCNKNNAASTFDPSKSAESNPYGYEDPDAVMPTVSVRREGMPRRRCSVTEYSLRDAHKAAAAATVMRLKRLGLTQVHSNAANEAANIASTGSPQRPLNRRRDRMGLFQRMPSSNDFDQQNDRNVAMKPPVRARSFEKQLPGVEKMDASKVQAIGSMETNQYGYEEHGPHGCANPNASNGTPAKAASNIYGYEDPDAAKTNPYGYGDSNPVARPRTRPRARRRGSVTKFSIEAAKAARVTNDTMAKEHQAAHAHSVPSSTVEPMTIDQTNGSDSVSPCTRAPLMPTRKHSPWQPEGISAYALRMEDLAQNSQSHLAPSMHSMTSGSFRDTNHSIDTFESSSDEEDSAYSFNDDDSLDDSVQSITIPLKTGDEPKRDRLMRPPDRINSCSSFESWDSNDDTASLALDLQSVCSISQRDQRTVGRNASGSLRAVGRTISGTVPPPPAFLRTPTPRGQSRKMPMLGLTAKRSSDKLQAVTRKAAQAAFEEAEKSTSGRAITQNYKPSQERMVDYLPNGKGDMIFSAPADASPMPSSKIMSKRTYHRSHSAEKLASLTATSTVRQN